MKIAVRKKISVVLAMVTALSLVGCSNEPSESDFDNPLPWHDSLELAPTGSYEKLEYSVAIYDTTKGVADDKRVQIAAGAMHFELNEQANGYTTLDTVFSVTYNESAPEEDRNLTDEITSTVEFETNSLDAKSMEKTVSLADRKDVKNLSYRLTADYFTHKATYLQTKVDGAKEKTRSLPRDACRDNEMMFFLARAQKIGKNSSTMFKMINVFDSFLKGETAEYTMSISGAASKKTIDIGNWVSEFGVEGESNAMMNTTTYSVVCYSVNIAISSENSGPPYTVLYTENPFKKNEKEHGKIPVKISYPQYRGGSPYRVTEYILTGCSFDNE
ncbi:MAG: hypothetical protein J1G01_01070 [Clostridiales bacterium]|nr:hypothetical protein [Clostridiales bacterium]